MEKTAALFLDFDNIYGSLSSASKSAANAFAQDPLSWVKWFEEGKHRDDGGDLLPQNIVLRACYLNPNMFGKFRKNFVFSGFRTIDCPALTGAGKNSADIHMVLDILDALNHNTKFDEFIILSADADFTPALLRLREWQRATSVISTAVTSDALRNAATNIIDIDTFIDEALGAVPTAVKKQVKTISDYVNQYVKENGGQLADDLPAIVVKKFPSFKDSNWLDFGTRRAWIASMVTEHSNLVLKDKSGQEFLDEKNAGRSKLIEAGTDQQSQVIAFIEDILVDEGGPLDGASIGHEVTHKFGPGIKEGKWFGFGRLSEFISTSSNGAIVFENNYAYLAEFKASAPSSSLPIADQFSGCTQDVINLVEKLSSAGWPRLAPKQIDLILSSTLRLIKEGVVERNPLSASIRDDIRNQVSAGSVPDYLSCGRQSINYILTGLLHQGVKFEATTYDLQALQTHFWNSMVSFHQNLFGEPTDEEYDLFDEIAGVDSEFQEQVNVLDV